MQHLVSLKCFFRIVFDSYDMIRFQFIYLSEWFSFQLKECRVLNDGFDRVPVEHESCTRSFI